MKLTALIEQVSERTAAKTATKTVQKLRRENMIRTSEWDAYKRTEKLLILYPKCTSNIEMAQALESIKNDAYYPVIVRHYFEKESFESIADSMGIHIRTVFQNRKRLVTLLSEFLYADDISQDLLNDK